jgi:hypothetical protein
MSSSRGLLLFGSTVRPPGGSGFAREKGPPVISSSVKGSMTLMAPIVTAVPPVFLKVIVL